MPISEPDLSDLNKLDNTPDDIAYRESIKRLESDLAEVTQTGIDGLKVSRAFVNVNWEEKYHAAIAIRYYAEMLRNYNRACELVSSYNAENEKYLQFLTRQRDQLKVSLVQAQEDIIKNKDILVEGLGFFVRELSIVINFPKQEGITNSIEIADKVKGFLVPVIIKSLGEKFSIIGRVKCWTEKLAYDRFDTTDVTLAIRVSASMPGNTEYQDYIQFAEQILAQISEI